MPVGQKTKKEQKDVPQKPKRKTQKGGSQASNALCDVMSPGAFARMDANATNEINIVFMKGGDVTRIDKYTIRNQQHRGGGLFGSDSSCSETATTHAALIPPLSVALGNPSINEVSGFANTILSQDTSHLGHLENLAVYPSTIMDNFHPKLQSAGKNKKTPIPKTKKHVVAKAPKKTVKKSTVEVTKPITDKAIASKKKSPATYKKK